MALRQAIAIDDMIVELVKASAKFPPFNSAHEGYAVLLEEVEELKDEVFWGPTKELDTFMGWLGTPPETKQEFAKRKRLKLMRAEAIQVAAMAMRFVIDVCDREATTNAGEPNTNTDKDA